MDQRSWLASVNISLGDDSGPICLECCSKGKAMKVPKWGSKGFVEPSDNDSMQILPGTHVEISDSELEGPEFLETQQALSET